LCVYFESLDKKKQTNKKDKRQTTKNDRKSKQDLSKYDFADEENEEVVEESGAKKRKKENDKLNTTANSSNATSLYESCTENETDEAKSKAKKNNLPKRSASENEKANEMRSAKRIAEGLRPIRTGSSEQANQTLPNRNGIERKNRPEKATLSRKLSLSSSNSTLSTSSSSIQPSKRIRLTTSQSANNSLNSTDKRANKKTIVYSDEDECEKNNVADNLNSIVQNGKTGVNVKLSKLELIKNDHSTSNGFNEQNKADLDTKGSDVDEKDKHDNADEKEEQTNESYSSSSSTMSSTDNDTINTFVTAGEDVFITDVTSGVLTVTIKESATPEGFFKKRFS